MSNNLRGKYAIAGVGHSALGKVPEMGPIGMFAVAARNAIADAGLTKGDVDGLITRGPDDVYCHHQRVGAALGLNVTYSTSTDNGGASQVLGVSMACMAIDAGLCNTVIVGFGRDTWSRTHRNETARKPGQHRHSEPGGVRAGVRLVRRPVQLRDFGQAPHAALRHHQGATGPHRGGVPGSCEPQPQRVLPETRDHRGVPERPDDRRSAVPVRLQRLHRRRRSRGGDLGGTRPGSEEPLRPHVMGFGFGNRLSGWFEESNMLTTGAKEAGEAAYRMAGIGPEDVDTAQLYDCFTQMVLLQLEDYGFCKKGEGGPFAGSGALLLDGAMPTNTSGGQLSEGHTEGMLQIVEGVPADPARARTGPAGEGRRDSAGQRARRQHRVPVGIDSGKGRIMSEYAKPLPYPTVESEPFWEGCKRHELLLPQCRQCSGYWFAAGLSPAPRCWSTEWDWQKASGRGKIHSFASTTGCTTRASKARFPTCSRSFN